MNLACEFFAFIPALWWDHCAIAKRPVDQRLNSFWRKRGHLACRTGIRTSVK